jgi:hypothetical protein
MTAPTSIGAAVLLGTLSLAIGAGLLFGPAGFFIVVGVIVLIIAWIALRVVEI